MSQYFPEPYERSGENVKVELDLPKYARKADLKEATGIDLSVLASKTSLSCLKTKVNNLDVDKLKTVPADLSKLSNVVDNVVKKTVYENLATKVNAIYTKIPSTSGLVINAKHESGKHGLEKNIEDFNKKHKQGNPKHGKSNCWFSWK